jgi:hypothetical protein
VVMEPSVAMPQGPSAAKEFNETGVRMPAAVRPIKYVRNLGMDLLLVIICCRVNW